MIEKTASPHPGDRFSQCQTEWKIIFQFVYGFVGGEK